MERGSAGLYACPMRLAEVLGALKNARTDAVSDSRIAEVDAGAACAGEVARGCAAQRGPRVRRSELKAV